MKTSQNNSNNKTKKFNRAKMVILLLVSSLSCLALYLQLSLHYLEFGSTIEVLFVFTPMLVFLCIMLIFIEDAKKAEIIARKEKEIQGWLDYSARLLGIVQESKTLVENMQKEIYGQDLSITKTISKTTQDLYKILSEGAPY